jgi:hypothetical protein
VGAVVKNSIGLVLLAVLTATPALAEFDDFSSPLNPLSPISPLSPLNPNNHLNPQRQAREMMEQQNRRREDDRQEEERRAADKKKHQSQSTTESRYTYYPDRALFAYGDQKLVDNDVDVFGGELGLSHRNTYDRLGKESDKVWAYQCKGVFGDKNWKPTAAEMKMWVDKFVRRTLTAREVSCYSYHHKNNSIYLSQWHKEMSEKVAAELKLMAEAQVSEFLKANVSCDKKLDWWSGEFEALMKKAVARQEIRGKGAKMQLLENPILAQFERYSMFAFHGLDAYLVETPEHYFVSRENLHGSTWKERAEFLSDHSWLDHKIERYLKAAYDEFFQACEKEKSKPAEKPSAVKAEVGGSEFFPKCTTGACGR